MSERRAVAETREAARSRAAVEMIGRYEQALRRTARRYSLDAEDAEDAYQRALEIALTKAPTTELRDLIRWTQTVTKHEALAVRRSRERLLGFRPRDEEGVPDPISLLPAPGDGPDGQVERREEVARSREALRALKPAELRALGLLAEGYSYAEIGERTGFSRTKVNRLLAEGRARLRGAIARAEDGRRCLELQPLLSAFCDGEASRRDAEAVREHLRACPGCRATARAYRRAPRLAAALLPSTLAPGRPWARLHGLLDALAAWLPGGGGGRPLAAQLAAAGGSRGAGAGILAKLATVCIGAGGGAAVGVATGVLPTPVLAPRPVGPPAIERPAAGPVEPAAGGAAAPREPASGTAAPATRRGLGEGRRAEEPAAEPQARAVAAVEYEPPPPPRPAPPTGAAAASGAATGGGSAAGEFGP